MTLLEEKKTSFFEKQVAFIKEFNQAQNIILID